MMRDGPDSRPWLRTVNLTKDTPGHVDPREGIVWQVETLLTQIGGRPCWKIEECVARCSAATPLALLLMRVWLLLSVATTISTRCRLKSTTNGLSPTLASLVRSHPTQHRRGFSS